MCVWRLLTLPGPAAATDATTVNTIYANLLNHLLTTAQAIQDFFSPDTDIVITDNDVHTIMQNVWLTMARTTRSLIAAQVALGTRK